ncbi:MAG: hypothetical protein RMJ33_01365 [Saprospiraceae bacterium]|nr:hypothetical protein [Saprospiraceae bacterium]MDW8228459.1 hypothetical protein [Saprospiraceae bacterium]
MTEENIQHVFGQVSKSLALEAAEPPPDEAALLALIAERVAELLEHQPEYLMSLLYRLDVLEEKIAPVMRGHSEEPLPVALARLILERQKQRIETRRTVKPHPMNRDEADEWAW